MLESRSESGIGKSSTIDMHDEDDELEYKQVRERAQNKQRRRRTLLTFFCVLVVLAVVAAIFGPTAINKLVPHTTTYQFKPVTQGDLTVSATATGPVQGNVYNATFAVSGKVAEIDVKVGQKVTSGQVLAKLDTKLLQDAVTQANGSNAPGQLETAKDNLAAATLYAPHAGVVTAINGTIGGPSSGLSTPGGSSGTSFIQIVDNSALHIQANVSESDISGVVPGATVQFTVSAYDRPFKGTVTTVVQQGVNVSNVITFPVLIDVDMKSLQNATVLPGMTASVTIDEAARRNVLLASTDAVSFAKTYSLVTTSQRADAQKRADDLLSSLLSSNPSLAMDNPTAAYVLQKDGGHWSVMPVVLGLTDGTNYEVLSGLSQGATIAVGGGTSSSPSTNTSPVSGGGGGD